MYYRAGYVLSTMFVATEVSTPLINLRWHMHEAGGQGSIWYRANGVAMVLVFFLCRVAALPWQVSGCVVWCGCGVWWWCVLYVLYVATTYPLKLLLQLLLLLATHKPNPHPPYTHALRQAKMVARHVVPLGKASHWLVSLQCVLSFALICVLNTWWFAKMAQGLLRLLQKQQQKDTHKKRNGQADDGTGKTAAAAAVGKRRNGGGGKAA